MLLFSLTTYFLIYIFSQMNGFPPIPSVTSIKCTVGERGLGFEGQGGGMGLWKLTHCSEKSPFLREWVKFLHTQKEQNVYVDVLSAEAELSSFPLSKEVRAHYLSWCSNVLPLLIAEPRCCIHRVLLTGIQQPWTSCNTHTQPRWAP